RGSRAPLRPRARARCRRVRRVPWLTRQRRHSAPRGPTARSRGIMTTGLDGTESPRDTHDSSPGAAEADSEQVAAAAPKGKLGSTALRFASALPLIPLILWLLFYGPRWGFHVFALTGVGVAARELMAMTMPGQK